jgi:hypothetical protein
MYLIQVLAKFQCPKLKTFVPAGFLTTISNLKKNLVKFLRNLMESLLRRLHDIIDRQGNCT